jgi:organic hydroperoxide reductase OsmC/OhrA
MSEHVATVTWQSDGGDFTKGRFSREHTWQFDGGLSVPASPSPSVVREPYSNPANVDPEEAYVASIASCHMLTFLFLASRKRFDVARYHDHAVGTVTKNDNGIPWVGSVVLKPRVEYAGENRPDRAEETALHESAHEQCFIANSIRTEIIVDLG